MQDTMALTRIRRDDSKSVNEALVFRNHSFRTIGTKIQAVCPGQGMLIGVLLNQSKDGFPGCITWQRLAEQELFLHPRVVDVSHEDQQDHRAGCVNGLVHLHGPARTSSKLVASLSFANLTNRVV